MQIGENDSRQTLRGNAEKRYRKNTGGIRKPAPLSSYQAKSLVHELQVYQIELEIQNEELRRTQAELEASQARYFGLFETAPVGYFTLDETGLVLEANLTAAFLLGTEKSALVKQRITRFVHPDDQDVFHLYFMTLLDVNGLQQCELRLKRNGNDFFWARMEASVMGDAKGAKICRITVSDVSDRKEAEKALQISEEKFVATFRSSPVLKVITTPGEGRIVDVNDAFLTTLGFLRDEVIGKTKIDLNIWQNPKDRDKLCRAFSTVGRLTGFEQQLRAKNGTIHTCIMSGEPINVGNESMFLIVITDITERKQTESRILELTKYPSRSPNPILCIDRNGILHYCNETAFGQLTEWHLQVGREVQHNLRDIVNKTLDSGFPQPIELKHRDRDFMFFVTPVIDPGYANLYGRDITEQRKTEKTLRERDVQLLQADKMASLGRIVSGVAHEINNPNNFIMLNAPLVRKAWESALPALKSRAGESGQTYIGKMPLEEFTDYVYPLIDGILDGSRRIARIVADLKDYARPENSDANQTIDFTQVVKSAVNLMRNTLAKKAVNLHLSIGDAPLMIQGGLQRLEQVLINLLQNSCDAIGKDGDRSISISLDNSRENDIMLCISDTGCGIAPGEMPHITEPFFTTKRATGGTGLGLSVSSKIVADHGGRLLFESEPGKGTTANLILPRRRI